MWEGELEILELGKWEYLWDLGAFVFKLAATKPVCIV